MLNLINHNGQFTADSREVAQMVGKRHDHLLRDIENYIQTLDKSETPNLGSLNFFIPSTYTTFENTKQYPCYLITRKGCDMVANKMTGEKGILFTATYVTKFEEMEKSLQKPTCIEDVMIQSLQEMKAIKQQVSVALTTATETKQSLESIRNTISLSPNSWRNDTKDIIVEISKKLGDISHINDVRKESYKLLDDRFGVDLETRLTNKRRRMAEEGVCKSKRDKLNKLDVIADDKKLIEGYVAIIKQMAVKYGL